MELLDNLNEIKSFTGQIAEIIDRSDKQLKINKETFNIFSCLTKHHLEELHTRLIRYLFNPNESHNCGSIFLKKFIDVIKEDSQLGGLEVIQRIQKEDMDEAVVELKDKYSKDHGKMDIYLETPNFIIVIENKVRAPEQDTQIERYVTYCEERCAKENKKFLVFFLTPNGIDSKQAGLKKYSSISYNTHIRKWIRECIKLFDDCATVHIGLKNYLSTLEKSVLHLSINNITVELIQKLQEEDNKIIIKYLPELYNVLVPLRNDLRSKFFVQVLTILQSKGYQFIAMDGITNKIDANLIWDEPARGFRLIDPEFRITISDEKCLDFCIEHDWDNLYFGLVAVIGQNKISVDFSSEFEMKKLYDELNEMSGFTLQASENCWMAYRYTSIIEVGKFGDDSLNYNFATQMDQYTNDFVIEIEKYLQALKHVANRFVTFRLI